MKNLSSKITIVAFLVFSLSYSQGDVAVPSKSPRATLTQQLGLTTITIDYGRPAVKGRDVYNDKSVIPGMQMGSWTAGAGKCTQLTISKDISINGKALKAGDYCLFMDIENDKATVNINSEYWQEAAFSYDPTKNVLELPVELKNSSTNAEWLQYTFEDLTEDSANLVMRWGNKQLQIPLKTNLEKNIMESFAKEMKGRAWFTWRGPYSAAKYAHDNDMHLEAALGWINTANSWNPNSFNVLKLKSNILAKLNKPTEAEQTMDLAIETGSPFELTQEGLHWVYVERNPDKGYKFLKKATEKAPNYHLAWSTLSSYYAATKDFKNAEKYLKKALAVGDKNKSWGPGEREQLEGGLKRMQEMQKR